MLISHGADVNRTNSLGQSVAHAICQMSHEPIAEIELLIKQYDRRQKNLTVLSGVDFSVIDKSNVTPLLKCVRLSRTQVISTLLRNGVMPELKHHPEGVTFLHALAQTSCDPGLDLLKEFVETAGSHSK